MIDWEALRADMPHIVEQLLHIMTEEALPMMVNRPAGPPAWPGVWLGYTTTDGDAFKVRLSIEEQDEEEDERT